MMIDLLIFLLVIAYCIYIIYKECTKSKDPNNCNGICFGCTVKCDHPNIVDQYYADHKRG